MLEVSHNPPTTDLAPSTVLPLAHAAKWPPDDGDFDAPGGGMPGGGMPGGFDPGDGDFKKGKVKPLVAVLLLGAIAVAGVIFLGAGAQMDAEEVDPEKAARLAEQTSMLPMSEQLPQWRQWATTEGHPLRERALAQLAWEEDPAGVDAAIAALKAPEQKIRAQAARALWYYGSPDADKARPQLLAALAEAGPESKPQIAWALVELGEAAAFEDIMALYRLGHLSTVRGLDEALAFDPNQIAKLVSLDKLAELHSDESPAVRQLVATVLSRNPAPQFTDALVALVRDPDRNIAAQAAPGLGKIGDERARKPLLEQLKGTSVSEKKVFLEALRDGLGTPGLVLALDSVSTETPTKEWHQTRQIFKMIREFADPKGAEALVEYLGRRGNHIHWQVEAALALAEIGDLRALPTLAARMRMDPQKIYSDDTDYEMLLKRDGKERVESARMIADLATLHPDEHERIRRDTESALIFWLHEMPSPHANGLRAMVNMGSTKDIQSLRRWANPSVRLPLEGQQPPMPEEWVIAQSALRYVGKLRDKPSWPVLIGMLDKRPEGVDATMDSLMAGGMAILGMTLRAVGTGAAEGLSEWGDRKAFKPLMEYIQEPKENEQSRMAACAALAWVAEGDDFIAIAEKIKEYGGPSEEDQVRQACLLETLITRPIAGTSEALIGLLSEDSSFNVRHSVARAIGKAGIEPSVEAQLFEKLKSEALVNDAALALMLGGNAEVAARALASFAGKPREIIDELQELWYRSFGYWSERDLEEGHLFRFVANAEAASRVELDGHPQRWVAEQLRRQFDTLTVDNGPHSFTRVVLRHRLITMALGDDPAVRQGAIATLEFMKERGPLLALRGEAGAVGELAGRAYFRLLHPVAAVGARTFSEEE